MLKRKHKDFIAFVIQDMIADIHTETAVTLEFVDQSVRNSIVSFTSYEDEEEDFQYDLSASYISTEAGRLVDR